MSDSELKKAIRTLRERANTAATSGRTDDATRIESTIRDYQLEMTQRL
ncbi:MAG: hypothetical protein GX542_12675 [Rhodococcus sp.]|nr:hypothetical protein [Rhodococcus sp. (in: high G+C Gram-positive bacteria)]